MRKIFNYKFSEMIPIVSQIIKPVLVILFGANSHVFVYIIR